MNTPRERAKVAMGLYDLIGEGDWTPQDLAGHQAVRDLLAALDRVEELERGLRRIGYEMPVTERNPDGDEQAAYSMQLVARDLLNDIKEKDDKG